jgi:hypothetical protein
MADNFTQFSCKIDLGTADKARAAIALLETMRCEPDDDEDPPYGFEAAVFAASPTIVYITDGDAYGDPEHVIKFVLACAEAFDLTGRWGFVWALTCSRQRLDGFGGGAQLLDLGERRSLAWLDCSHWLLASLDPATPVVVEGCG